MKKFITIVLLAIFALSATAQTAPKKVYDETINQMEQIDKAVKQAKAEGKFVMCRLGYTASGSISATVITYPHAARRPVGGGGEVEFAVTDVRVGAVTDEVGAIY